MPVHGIFLQIILNWNLDLTEFQQRLNGDAVRHNLDENSSPSIRSRVGLVAYGHWSTTQKPTATQQRNIEIAESDFSQFRTDLSAYFKALASYEAALEAANAPYTHERDFE